VDAFYKSGEALSDVCTMTPNLKTGYNFGYMIFNDPNYFSFSNTDIVQFDQVATWTNNDHVELKVATTEKR